jgi:hypothetical protein
LSAVHVDQQRSVGHERRRRRHDVDLLGFELMKATLRLPQRRQSRQLRAMALIARLR